MCYTLVDAIFLCAFYALISLAFAPFVLQQDTTQLYLAPYALLAVAGRLIFRILIARLIARISFQIEGTVRSELINQLLAAGPLSQAVRSSSGTLFVDTLDDIMPYFTSFMVTLRYAMVIPVVCLIAVALVSPWSALILFAMAPLIPFFMIVIGKGAERLNQRQWKQITRLAMRFQEALDQIVLIRLFHLEHNEILKIARMTRRWRTETMQVLRIAFISALVLEFFATCGIALCAITLGFAVYEHGFDYTRALFVLLLAPEFFLPLRQMGFTYHARMRALGAMSELMPFLAEHPRFPLTPTVSTAEPEAARTAAGSNGPETAAVGAAVGGNGPEAAMGGWMQAPYDIELEDVTAVYPNGRTGLAHCSCSLKSGVVTALTGPSGAGKSTILQTVAGFTTIASGRVRVNGHICSTEDLLALMSEIAYIPQQPHLFYGTLRDNLRIGRPDATDEELMAALKLVGAEVLLQRFKDGLEHHVGDLNRGISGGETRLIALARAMVRDCPVLLLDEPTASLDRDSENAFLAALTRICSNSGKTVVIVAHRHELIDFADTVIALSPSVLNDEDEVGTVPAKNGDKNQEQGSNKVSPQPQGQQEQ